jgi:hypothetical protein
MDRRAGTLSGCAVSPASASASRKPASLASTELAASLRPTKRHALTAAIEQVARDEGAGTPVVEADQVVAAALRIRLD